MTDRIRIIKHALLRSKCGSFEVRFADGRESRFFYWDDAPSRRPRLKMLPSEQALEQAKAFKNTDPEDAFGEVKMGSSDHRPTFAVRMRHLPPTRLGSKKG